MPDSVNFSEIDSKAWLLIGGVLLLGIGLGFIIKPMIKPCGCEEQSA